MSEAITAEVKARLDEGLAALQIDIDAGRREQLLRLVALLHKWNRAYNLTAIRSPEEMVVRHLLDSAAVLPFVGDGPLLDVGAGPGFPGLVLAILEPRLAVTLLDSNGKKVRFQRQAVMELGLANVTPVQSRVEAFGGPAQGYAQVISRAFASLADFVRLTDHLLASGGHWLAMKGPAAEEEAAALEPGVSIRERHALGVPFTPEGRQLLIVERTDSNPGRH
jgi:16S rRNA (guanine527-N7)-methyltransferase